MTDSIRDIIIDHYKETGKPISLESVAIQEKLSIEEVKKNLNDSPTFDNYMGLTIAQLTDLMDYYGKGVLFNREIEDLVKKFLETKRKIKEFEKRSLER